LRLKETPKITNFTEYNTKLYSTLTNLKIDSYAFAYIILLLVEDEGGGLGELFSYTLFGG
jgi:hypothetical protein